MNNSTNSTVAATRILIIDDDDIFAGVLQRAFKKRGYLAEIAADEDSALALAHSFKPDLISLDLKLEASSGLTLLPLLVEKLPLAKIVILTGYSSITTAVEAIKLCTINYLCKPVDADEVLAALQQQDGNPATPLAEQPMSVNRLTWEHIQKVLHENDGNISATARALGMHRRTLQRKLQKRPVKH